MAKTYKDATKAVKEYIKRFFPRDKYNISVESNGNDVVYTLENNHNLGNSRDIEYIAIYEQQSKSFEDFVKTFDKYQENIERHHKEVMGETEFDFVIEKV